MWCMKCNKDLSECTCPDLEERLDRAVVGGRFVYKYCKICGKHYERCKCKKPIWEIKDQPKGTKN
ncbi:hypothetical protein ES705_05319 [subsurface metagenome]